jgi:hypothetical protein
LNLFSPAFLPGCGDSISRSPSIFYFLIGARATVALI